jgi:hypothetical protein
MVPESSRRQTCILPHYADGVSPAVDEQACHARGGREPRPGVGNLSSPAIGLANSVPGRADRACRAVALLHVGQGGIAELLDGRVLVRLRSGGRFDLGNVRFEDSEAARCKLPCARRESLRASSLGLRSSRRELVKILLFSPGRRVVRARRSQCVHGRPGLAFGCFRTRGLTCITTICLSFCLLMSYSYTFLSKRTHGGWDTAGGFGGCR